MIGVVGEGVGDRELDKLFRRFNGGVEMAGMVEVGGIGVVGVAAGGGVALLGIGGVNSVVQAEGLTMTCMTGLA